MIDNKVNIDGKEYEVSKLRCKHLRQLSLLVKEPPGKGFEIIDRYMPYLFESLKIKNPSITMEVLDELELQEFSDAWKKVVALSGVQLLQGEGKPMESNGEESTGGSPVPPAGTIVQ